jgi:hypothetical protein
MLEYLVNEIESIKGSMVIQFQLITDSGPFRVKTYGDLDYEQDNTKAQWVRVVEDLVCKCQELVGRNGES